jgi:hypothetical protein
MFRPVLGPSSDTSIKQPYKPYKMKTRSSFLCKVLVDMLRMAQIQDTHVRVKLETEINMCCVRLNKCTLFHQCSILIYISITLSSDRQKDKRGNL